MTLHLRGLRSEAERAQSGFEVFNKADGHSNGQRGWRETVPSFHSLFMCVCVCTQPCIREGGLSERGPIRSSGVLCIVIAASGCFVCVCLSSCG